MTSKVLTIQYFTYYFEPFNKLRKETQIDHCANVIYIKQKKIEEEEKQVENTWKFK